MRRSVSYSERNSAMHTQDKGGFLGVFELGVDLGVDFAHAFELGKHVFLVGTASAEHRLELAQHRSETSSQRRKLGQSLFQNAWEGEES